jgi:hypothetical protein
MSSRRVCAVTLVDRNRPRETWVLGRKDDREPTGAMGAHNLTGQILDFSIGAIHVPMMSLLLGAVEGVARSLSCAPVRKRALFWALFSGR